MADKYQTYYQGILAQLRRAIEENLITQKQLGDALGVSQSAVSQLLAGKSKLTLEQFLQVSDLVRIRPQTILGSAEVEMTAEEAMTPEMQATLYRSVLHLLAYCAATQPIAPDDLKVFEPKAATVRDALTDLVKCGLLKKEGGRFVQANPRINYAPSDASKRANAHQTIIRHSWTVFDAQKANTGYRKTRFNFSLVDRFTVAQMKEIEAMLWKAYERTTQFQKDNMARSYVADQAMPLWNIHLMLMTPLEDK